MLSLAEAAPPSPHAARADGPGAADRGHRPADRRAGLRAVCSEGGGDRDCGK